MWNHETRFIQNHALLSTEIDDELVMISDDQEHFISLNAMGKFIFDGLSSPKSMGELVGIVLAHCDHVGQVQCKADLALFLDDLMQQQLVFEHE